jgi:sugar lactone lactonase YvrE
MATRTITTRGGEVDIGLERAGGSARLIARAAVSAGGLTSTVLDGDVVMLKNLVPGDLEISAEAVHSDCAIVGGAARVVRITTDTTARADFSISCAFVPEERIVYNTQAPLGFDDAIYSVRPDGSDRRLVTDQDLGFPAWSPDGTRILAGSGTLWIMNYDGTEMAEIGRGARPAWSPDGRKIAFERDGDLAVADLEGRRFTNLAFLTMDGSALDDEGPSWSPDGSTIVFHRGDVVHRIQADGSELRALAAGIAAVWMPDGSRIVFAHSESGQIASMKPDGTDLRLLTDLEFAGHPDPSPDGQRIVFHSPRGPENRLWTVKADGTDPRMIDAVPAPAGHANWGPP